MSTMHDTVRPAGSRRFVWTVLAFAVANAAVWVGYLIYRGPAASLSAMPTLRVERIAPGEAQTLNPRQALTWTFNADVGPERTGAISDAPGNLVPNVPGQWSWSDRRTLTFTPERDYPKATRFTLTLLPQKLAPPAGLAAMPQPFVATVQTPALKLTGARHIGAHDGQPLLELSFNDALLASDVLKHVSVASSGGSNCQISLYGKSDGKVVRLRCEEPVAIAPVGAAPPSPPLVEPGRNETSYTVVITPGLAGTSGPLGIEQKTTHVVTVARQLMATGAQPHCPPNGDPEIQLSFNGNVEPEILEKVLAIEPAMPLKVQRRWGTEVAVQADFKPGTRYSLKIQPPPAGASGYPKPGTLSVFIPDRPAHVWLDHEEGYLGARGNRSLAAHAVNVPALRVTIIRVYDNTLVAWRNAADRRRYGRLDPAPFARPIVSRRIDLNAAAKNAVQDVTLSLDELLPESFRGDGVYRIQVEPESAAAAAREYDGDDSDFPRYGGGYQKSAMITLSDIGLSAKQGRDGQTSVWAVSLSSGKPIDGVRVRLYSTKSQPLAEVRTGTDGLATLKSAAPAPGEQPAVLIADRAAAGDQSSQLTWLDLRTAQTSFADADTGGREFLRSGYEAFVYTDRGVYRPGETVQLRTVFRGSNQSVPQPFPIKWQLRRPDLREWKSQVVTLDADGAAGLTLALPADLPTGRWTAQVGLAGETRGPSANLGSVTFQVEEYIPERIKASLTVTAGGKNPPRLSLDAKNIQATLQADYLFGRPVAKLPATLKVSLAPSLFTSPAWRGWSFGDTANTAAILTGRASPTRRMLDAPDATTTDAGQARWPIDLKKLQQKGETEQGEPAPRYDGYRGPWDLTLVGVVREEGGRPVGVSQTIAVDGAPHYLGIRLQESSPRAGSATVVSLAAVAPSGEVHAADVTVEATLCREEWNSVLLQEQGHYRYQSTRNLKRIGEARKLMLGQGRGQLELTTPSGGRYVVVVRDPASQVESSLAFYAIEPAWQENISRENPEKVDLVLLPGINADPVKDLVSAVGQLKLNGEESGKSWRSLATATGTFVRTLARAADASADSDAAMKFKVGQRPRVLVRSPFAGQLLLCIETDSVVSRKVVEMTGSQMIVPIEVTDACRPGAFITATVIRNVDPNVKWRAHRAFGVARLPLDSGDRRLNVAINTPTEIRPEQTLSATVRLTDDNGSAVSGAAVTVAAVDEGILQLTRFKTPDPLAFFLSPRTLGVKSADLYSMLMPEVPKPQAAVGGDNELRGPVFGNGGNARSRSIPSRRVKSVALFCGVVHTDANGIARIELPVPAFTGKLRLMAVAYSGGGTAVSGFGSGEAETLVRSPLLVQTSLPRFAAPGDRFVMPLTIFNNSQRAGQAKIRVSIESSNANPPPLGIAGGDPKAVELPAVVLTAGGQTSRSIELTAGPGVGAAKIRVTATMDGETFTETIELPIRPPAPELSDGGYLTAKPDAPAKIAPPEAFIPGTRRLQVRVTPWPNLGLSRGLQYLDRYPYGCAEQTLSTSFPLVYLGDIGQRLAPGMFDRERIADKVQAGILRLMSMQTHDGGIAMWPGGGESWPWASVYAAHFLIEAQSAGHAVPEDFREHLLSYCRRLLEKGGDDPALIEQQAYACYVLSLAGKPPRATMSRLTELMTRTADKLAVPQGTPRWHIAMAWAAAGRRDQAQAILPAFLPMQQDVRQLGGNLSSRLRDRAMNLQAVVAIDPSRPETVALAMDVSGLLNNQRYLGTQETAVALCALGRYLKAAEKPAPYEGVELWAGDTRLASADAGRELIWDLPADGSLPKDLQVRVQGKPECKAFVSWLQNAVPAERPKDASQGDLQITRRFLDIAGKPLAWNGIKSGDLIQVEMEVKSRQGVENVVIEDLLPAGMEVENPRLQSGAAAALAADATRAEEPNAFHVAHTDFRDDRVCVMGSFKSGGKGKVSYLARAVTPGTYVFPPVRAECMYDAGIHCIWSGEETMKVAGPEEKGLVMR